MIGWRARFGIISPSVNSTTETKFYRCIPEGVNAHFTRMEFKETTPEYFERMIQDISSGARMLSHANIDATIFACTSGSLCSLYGGLGCDQKIISQRKAHFDIAVSTTSMAATEAFRILGIKNIAVATFYEAWVDKLVKDFFEGR